jgi:pre-rRNA-processing protein TSR3
LPPDVRDHPAMNGERIAREGAESRAAAARASAGGAALDVLVLRDPRESVKKCSLTPLRGTAGVRFVEYDRDRRVEVGERVLLHPDGEELSLADRGRGLLVIDCAWRRVDALLATVDGDLERRRLPPLFSAYPRKSRIFADPERGLASLEAIYAALAVLGIGRPELLDGYRWKEEFLLRNPALPR